MYKTTRHIFHEISPPPKIIVRDETRYVTQDRSNTFKNISEYAYGKYLTKYTTERFHTPHNSWCLHCTPSVFFGGKKERAVVFFVASHNDIAIQTVPVTIQNPKQIAASL